MTVLEQLLAAYAAAAEVRLVIAGKPVVGRVLSILGTTRISFVSRGGVGAVFAIASVSEVTRMADLDRRST